MAKEGEDLLEKLREKRYQPVTESEELRIRIATQREIRKQLSAEHKKNTEEYQRLSRRNQRIRNETGNNELPADLDWMQKSRMMFGAGIFTPEPTLDATFCFAYASSVDEFREYLIKARGKNEYAETHLFIQKIYDRITNLTQRLKGNFAFLLEHRGVEGETRILPVYGSFGVGIPKIEFNHFGITEDTKREEFAKIPQLFFYGDYEVIFSNPDLKPKESPFVGEKKINLTRYLARTATSSKTIWIDSTFFLDSKDIEEYMNSIRSNSWLRSIQEYREGLEAHLSRKD